VTFIKKSTRKRAGMWLRADKFFGVPRWAAVCVGIGVLLGIGIFGRPVHAPEPVSDRVKAVAEGLRTTSVYEEKPGVPGVIDAERARDLIGDRPIVLVLLDDTRLPKPEPLEMANYDLCDEIARVVPTSLVIVYATLDTGEYDQAYCTGPQFSNPQNPVDASNYSFGLLVKAELSWKYRVTDEDKFPEVEEFVFAFDEQAREDYPNGVPTRAVVVPAPPTPDALQTRTLVLSLGGVVLAPVALFALLRLIGGAATRRSGRAKSAHTRQEAINTRLNRLADVILHPPKPSNAEDAHRQADLAERYVSLLGAVESARSRSAQAEVEAQLSELEREVSG
jgi:hypothetical protein